MIKGVAYEEKIIISDENSNKYSDFKAIIRGKTANNNVSEISAAKYFNKNNKDYYRSKEIEKLEEKYNDNLNKYGDISSNLVSLEYATRAQIRQIELKERFMYVVNEANVNAIIKIGKEMNIDNKLIVESIITTSSRFDGFSESIKKELVDYIVTFDNENSNLLEMSEVITRLMNIEIIIDDFEGRGDSYCEILESEENKMKVSWENDKKLTLDNVVLERHSCFKTIFNHELTHFVTNNYQKVYEKNLYLGISVRDIKTGRIENTYANEGLVSVISDNITRMQGIVDVEENYEIEKEEIIKSGILKNINIKNPEENDYKVVREIEMAIDQAEIDKRARKKDFSFN